MDKHIAIAGSNKLVWEGSELVGHGLVGDTAPVDKNLLWENWS